MSEENKKQDKAVADLEAKLSKTSKEPPMKSEDRLRLFYANITPEQREARVRKILSSAVADGRTKLTDKEERRIYRLMGGNARTSSIGFDHEKGFKLVRSNYVKSPGRFGLSYTDENGQSHEFKVAVSDTFAKRVDAQRQSIAHGAPQSGVQIDPNQGTYPWWRYPYPQPGIHKPNHPSAYPETVQIGGTHYPTSVVQEAFRKFQKEEAAVGGVQAETADLAYTDWGYQGSGSRLYRFNQWFEKNYGGTSVVPDEYEPPTWGRPPIARPPVVIDSPQWGPNPGRPLPPVGRPPVPQWGPKPPTWGKPPIQYPPQWRPVPDRPLPPVGRPPQEVPVNPIWWPPTRPPVRPPITRPPISPQPQLWPGQPPVTYPQRPTGGISTDGQISDNKERNIEKILSNAASEKRELTQKEQNRIYRLMGGNKGTSTLHFGAGEGWQNGPTNLMYSPGRFRINFTDSNGAKHRFGVGVSTKLVNAVEGGKNTVTPYSNFNIVPAVGNAINSPQPANQGNEDKPKAATSPEFTDDNNQNNSAAAQSSDTPVVETSVDKPDKQRATWPEDLTDKERNRRVEKILSIAASEGRQLTDKEQLRVYTLMNGSDGGRNFNLDHKKGWSTDPESLDQAQFAVWQPGKFSIDYTDQNGNQTTFGIDVQDRAQIVDKYDGDGNKQYRSLALAGASSGGGVTPLPEMRFPDGSPTLPTKPFPGKLPDDFVPLPVMELPGKLPDDFVPLPVMELPGKLPEDFVPLPVMEFPGPHPNPPTRPFPSGDPGFVSQDSHTSEGVFYGNGAGDQEVAIDDGGVGIALNPAGTVPTTPGAPANVPQPASFGFYNAGNPLVGGERTHSLETMLGAGDN